jgi:hypothetical protein
LTPCRVIADEISAKKEETLRSTEERRLMTSSFGGLEPCEVVGLSNANAAFLAASGSLNLLELASLLRLRPLNSLEKIRNV